MAAVCQPQAIGPWDRKPVRSAGRLANYLDLHAERFFALALTGVEPRNYRKNPTSALSNCDGRVNMFKFDAGICNGEAPVEGRFYRIAFGFPETDFLLDKGRGVKAAVETLAVQDAQPG